TLAKETIDRIAEEIGRHDPQADVRLALVCPDCSHRWETIFDIVSLVFNEISAWASRILRQVHLLSLAYGWREIDILSLSPLRRQAYLELLGE
ncbi:MAG: phage baseplate protein, partial [Pyrinomonadaceae bacterium]